jgi:anaerobic ribonucleoside-triphosphate reductase
MKSFSDFSNVFSSYNRPLSLSNISQLLDILHQRNNQQVNQTNQQSIDRSSKSNLYSINLRNFKMNTWWF